MSVRNFFLKFFLHSVVKPVTANVEIDEAFSKLKQRYTPFRVYLKHLRWGVSKINGYPVYRLSRKSTLVPKKSLIYLHGGSFCLEISFTQWKVITDFIKRSDVDIEVIVPIYPLSKPNYSNQADNIKLVEAVYLETLKQYKAENIYLLGDSAGGNLALSFCQLCLDKKIKQPAHLIMLSPWLNLALDNPKVIALTKKDTWLPLSGMKMVIQWYTQGDDATKPIYSPAKGEINGLAPITIFACTGECLIPDIEDFHKRLENASIKHDYYLTKGMYHDWAIFAIPESKPVWDKVAEIIK